MIDIFPTSHEPMKGFVAKMRRLEKTRKEVLAISLVHGFMAADVPEMGTKVLVVTDDRVREGDALAEELAEEVFAMRGGNMLAIMDMQEGVTRAMHCRERPVVIADVWDNPGGGVPGDSTHLLRHLRQRKVRNAAFSSLWDPQAVERCMTAGAGAEIQLQFGGKSCASVGPPMDAHITIKTIAPESFQSFGESRISLGRTAVVALEGIEVILHSHRTQTYEPNIFSNLGLDPHKKDLLIVKSTNHFFHGFSRLTKHIYYVNAPTCYPNDPRVTEYHKVRRPFWPQDPLQWQDVVSLQDAFAHTR